MTPSLAASYRHCEDIARREAANFYPAFRLLPGPERLAMCALYAFLRIADDCGDADLPLDVRAKNLDDWRRGLAEAAAGKFSNPTHEALHHTLEHYRIPLQYLNDVLDGVAMDLEAIRYETWDDLKRYCYRVASAVGLACIHIWGFRDASALPLAEDAGYAFQLTNILRDLKEDAGRGRVYLPTEDLARFRYDPAGLASGVRDVAFRELMRFEMARARAYYDSSAALAPLLPPPGRAVYLMMSRTYRALLDEIERRDFDVFSERVRVGRWTKLKFAAGVLPVRLGLWGGTP